VSTPEPYDDVSRALAQLDVALAQSDAAANPRLSQWMLLGVIFPVLLTVGMIAGAMLAGWVTAPLRG
jgi:hypothetical protein